MGAIETLLPDEIAFEHFISPRETFRGFKCQKMHQHSCKVVDGLNDELYNDIEEKAILIWKMFLK